MNSRRAPYLREVSTSTTLEVHQRSGLRSNPQSPVVQGGAHPSLSNKPGAPRLSPRHSPRLSPRLTPLLPSPSEDPPSVVVAPPAPMESEGPRICGLPLKYISLVTLAVQNAALSIVMHYSRVSIPASEAYSPATAVFLNELLKGSISFVVALYRVVQASDAAGRGVVEVWAAFRRVCKEIFSNDCWKLSIPALLYVIQNSLQFVAVSNLPVATFQVTYQMKILTTAAFSVALLRKRLSSTKWLALLFLAIGVAIVQIQSINVDAGHQHKSEVGSEHEIPPPHVHVMSPLKGFGAVTAACFTSGLAGVYFEMVLKGSKADLWVRNVQLSLFSLIPAALPIFWESAYPHTPAAILSGLFHNFGGWAWATVSIQVLGGLITALVIKYSDNIMKGFATSLSIVLSFLASVALFGFGITPSFVVGSITVLLATWMYNQPPGKELSAINKVMANGRPVSTSYPITPVSPNAPILGHFGQQNRSPSYSGSRTFATALGFSDEKLEQGYNQTATTSKYLNAPYGSPYPSRTPSPQPPPLRSQNSSSMNGSSPGSHRL
ncbi:nucleotide-sugar transporter-domain-containing protein [Irpex lacteus]|nr:nucleotide-sugar transporter-domain-containing protein [Irpex lacteus]